jgi:hypothetical protein
MALWGNNDSKTASGTVSIADTGVVTGSSTAFATQAKIGNTIKTSAGVEYQIVTITSDTVAKVIMGTNNGNGTVTTASGLSYTLSEKPSSVAHESADSGVGVHGNSSKVFGVDTTEQSAGGDNVTNVAVANAGLRYLEVPAVTFSGGGGTSAAATASIAGGVVTAITVTNVGSAYTSAPTVAIAIPRRTIPTSGITTATDTIAYTAHGLSAGDAVKYFHGGGAAATGLTNNTTYYVIASGLTANAFKVSATDGGSTVDITGTGNNAQYFELATAVATNQATATASLGSFGTSSTKVTHAGWVRRTVGTGGRAGRVQYETLVAAGSIAGDQADDIQFPDA